MGRASARAVPDFPRFRIRVLPSSVSGDRGPGKRCPCFCRHRTPRHGPALAMPQVEFSPHPIPCLSSSFNYHPSAGVHPLLPPTEDIPWPPSGMLLSASRVTPPHPVPPSRLISPGTAGPYSATPSSIKVNPSVLGQRCSEEASSHPFPRPRSSQVPVEMGFGVPL